MKQLENIVHQYPKDVDAKLFLALFNMSGYDENMDPRKGTIYSEYLLRELLISNVITSYSIHYTKLYDANKSFHNSTLKVQNYIRNKPRISDSMYRDFYRSYQMATFYPKTSTYETFKIV